MDEEVFFGMVIQIDTRAQKVMEKVFSDKYFIYYFYLTRLFQDKKV